MNDKINDTISNQNKLLGKSTESGIPGMSKSTSDLLTKIFGSLENAYPPLATTPEGAQKAISACFAKAKHSFSRKLKAMFFK